MKPYHPDLQKHSPFRPPDWRWRRANWLVARGLYHCRRRDDEDTGRAVRYLRSLASRPGTRGAAALRRYRDVHSARQIRECAGPRGLFVEARVLARQTPGEIARLTGISEDAVRSYEALFFDGRDRLDARDWVTVHLIGKRSAAGVAPAPEMVLKSFAYHGGPLVLEAVLPYLIGSRDLLEHRPDLTTPEGRLEQAVRLAVASQMLPSTAATANRLHQIMLILRERERNWKAPVQAAPLLADKLDVLLEELAPRVRKEAVPEAEMAPAATVAAALKQTG